MITLVDIRYLLQGNAMVSFAVGLGNPDKSLIGPQSILAVRDQLDRRALHQETEKQAEHQEAEDLGEA